ncbi:ABC transporter ATP-binding protein [Bifidobacterium catulorum]|uniref:ABC-type quaternary amine transporter n=1 Tax=Bifidobacterium catulorum TaxID=1630173 RepID=A0A2U2MSR8_9BIFI|nr:ATP-binding cassette domain-containing protein [Bifidobacterium catulorum]PWG59896.1 ABC transporter ATP-binding protein [Bifidobacterium catulorum]
MTIVFDHVSKTYDDGTIGVGDVSLTVRDGEVMVLVGPSGSGKTTLMRMVNRMVEPTSGRVLIDGRDVRGRDPIALRRSIGYVIQGGGLLPHRTVVDNIATIPMLNGVGRKRARDHAMGLLGKVGLDASLAGRYPAQLSGGQRQRVGVARALAADARILLMDEPFSAVDPVVRRELQNEVRRVQHDFGVTVVFVTHDINEAFFLADRIALLGDGGVLEQVDVPSRILGTPANERVRAFVEAGRPRMDKGVRCGLAV